MENTGTTIDSLSSLSKQVESDFVAQFDRKPTLIVAAPGRVNLIGEHIDYNDGFVLPLALERNIVIAAAIRESEPKSTVRIFSNQLNQSETIQVDEPLQPGREGWVTYIEGVLAGFAELGQSLPTFDAVVGSSVPLGGGLSSSAALEVAMATLMEQLTGHVIEPIAKALLCQKAEHQFAGVPCGIMDQFSSVFGRPDELMLIDCRSQEIEFVPFNTDDVSVLITNSNVKHDLTGGEYAIRRSECDSALLKLSKTTWRDVTLKQLEDVRHLLTDTECRRSKHVITETQRTIQAAEAIRQSDWQTVGQLMYESHDSLRDEYEVSCDELDVLVDIAKSIGTQGGVFGSRMTGGGFGGCTVSIVENKKMSSVIESLATRYEAETGIKPQCFCSRPGRGAHVINAD